MGYAPFEFAQILLDDLVRKVQSLYPHSEVTLFTQKKWTDDGQSLNAIGTDYLLEDGSHLKLVYGGTLIGIFYKDKLQEMIWLDRTQLARFMKAHIEQPYRIDNGDW